MLSGPQSYIKSNSASYWYSFQCNLQCRIQTGIEFCWVTQHLQMYICSTLLCTIYCLNFFAKMLSGPQSYMESNSASNWYSFQCNLQCRIQHWQKPEFVDWLANNSKSTRFVPLYMHNLLPDIILHLHCYAEYQIVEWNKSAFGGVESLNKVYMPVWILHCKLHWWISIRSTITACSTVGRSTS